MYSSELTNRKRAQVLYSDLARQKKDFTDGKLFRMTYQKGGTDYSYMMELEQGCINNTCTGEADLNYSAGDVITIMDKTYAIYIDPIPLIASGTCIEYGYAIYVDPATGNSICHIDQSGNVADDTQWYTRNSAGTVLHPGVNTAPPAGSYLTCDDVYLPLPIGNVQFYFFGIPYTNNQIYWSTNCALLFGTTVGGVAFSPPDHRIVSVRSDSCPAVLLGNGDRRLDKLYIRDDSVSGKYYIITLFVYYEGYNRQMLHETNPADYQVRLIRELTGFNRQWIEVRMRTKPLDANGADSPGYTSGMLTSDTSPVPPYGYIYADANLNSPYNITDGTTYYNPCGSTFATVNPVNGSSMTFESNATGTNWTFRNNTSVPV